MSRTLTITFDGEVDGALTVTLNGEVGVASVGDPTSFISFINVGPTGATGPAGTPAVQPTGTGIPHVIGGTTQAAASAIVDTDITGPITVSKIAPGSSFQNLSTVAGVAAWATSPQVVIVWKTAGTLSSSVVTTEAELKARLTALLSIIVGRIMVYVDGNATVSDGTGFDMNNRVSFDAIRYDVASSTTITFTNNSYFRNVLTVGDSLLFQGAPTTNEFLRFDLVGGSFGVAVSGGVRLTAGATKSAILVTGDYTRFRFDESVLDNLAASTVPLIKIDGAVTYCIATFLNGGLSYIPVSAKVFGTGNACFLDQYYDSETASLGTQTSFSGTQSITRLAKLANVAPSTGATGARPTGAAVGQMYWDSTLQIPIWYTGSNWKNASGGVV